MFRHTHNTLQIRKEKMKRDRHKGADQKARGQKRTRGSSSGSSHEKRVKDAWYFTGENRREREGEKRERK